MQDEEKTVNQTLYFFIIVALLGSISILVSALFASHGAFTTFSFSGLVGVITCLIVLWLLHIKQFSIPRFILPSVVYILATYLIFTGATVSVRDDAVLLFSLVVAMAGLLLGKKGVVIFGVLSVLTVSISVYAEINGLLVNYITRRTTTYNTMVNSTVIYGLTFGMMYILVDILTANLSKMRSNEQALKQANQELLTVRESLELQVTERTRAAESARAEAESARRDAESQAWLTRGQAQLAEKMRGDQSLETLANNVTSFLSQYLGAHTGALFLVSDNVLKLIGGYAYSGDERKNKFRLDENLAGEAARTNRVIILKTIPEDTPLVFSALGGTKPQQIMIAPIVSEGQVFGVMELGTLAEFSSKHEMFLRRISESIAIGFHTAQTRIQVNELLKKSQQQAEELSAQEEELRAANEELQTQAETLRVARERRVEP